MPTAKQKLAVKKTLENLGSSNPKPQGRILAEVGYSPAIVKNPQIITESRGFKELFDEHISESFLVTKHRQLLSSTKIEHMIFPLGPKDADDENFSGAHPNSDHDEDEEDGPMAPEEIKERTNLSDKEIIEMLAEVNCKVRRIVHGETARHVYFWAADNKAQDSALEMAYKLKGSYAPTKTANVNVNISEATSAPAVSALRDEFNKKAKEIVVEQIKKQ